MGKPLLGIMGRVLEVDLTTGRHETWSFPEEDWLAFLGGKGLGAKLLLQRLPPGTDPLGPDNLLVFTTGLLTGSGAPCTSRFNLSTKSPLTGTIGFSNCGGTFGMHLRRAGYDALVVRGCAERPVFLEIREDRVRLRDARHLWGLDTVQTLATLPDQGARIGSLTIGPAGEQLVRYACIMSGHRTLGRGGTGAVMGAKNLKLVTAAGTRAVPVADSRAFGEVVESWTRQLQSHPITANQLPRYGTAGLASTANATHTLPIRNFQQGHVAELGTASGEGLAETILVRNSQCRSCPIRCARVASLDGRTVKGPEFETLGMFGPNQGTFEIEAITRLGLECDRLGLDTISAGATLACAMELTERGLLPSDLRFGHPETALAALGAIARREGLGDDLAEGSWRLAKKYGAPELAMQSKGLEFASYDPRNSVGLGLGYAVSNRGGCHLGAGYLIFFEALGPVQMDPLTPLGKPALTVMQQNLMDAVTSAGCCTFTTYAVVPGGAEQFISLHGPVARLVSRVLVGSRFVLDHQMKLPAWSMAIHVPTIPHTRALSALTGRSITLGDFLAAGERGHLLERMFNLREGFTAADDRLPPRLTQEPERSGEPRSVVPLDRLLPRYYAIRGWDAQGVPRSKIIRRLGLDWLEPLRQSVLQQLPQAAALRERRDKEQAVALRGRLASNRQQQDELSREREALGQLIRRQEQIARTLEVRGALFRVDVTRCGTCGQCAQVCPAEGALRWEPGRQAQIVEAACVHCGRCESACPPRFAAITRTAPPAEATPPPIYRVDPERCRKCGLCHPACPVGAITWQKREQARIDEEICVRCGRCYAACPTKFSAILQLPSKPAAPSQEEVSPPCPSA